MMVFRPYAAVVATALVSSACDPSPPDASTDGESDVTFTEFDCELGLMKDESFMVTEGDTKAELWLGFQGLLFVSLAVSARGDVPDETNAIYRVEIDGERAQGGRIRGIEAYRTDTEAAIFDDVLVFFNNDSISDLVGVTANVSLRLEDKHHQCTTSGSFVLVDDDPCIHASDEPICPEDDDDDDNFGQRDGADP